MNSKQRVHASLEGKPVDRFPVAANYSFLVYNDHFAEITRQPQWRLQEWLSAKDGQAYLAYYRQMHARTRSDDSWHSLKKTQNILVRVHAAHID